MITYNKAVEWWKSNCFSTGLHIKPALKPALYRFGEKNIYTGFG